MPEVVSDSSYDLKKMLESCPQELQDVYRMGYRSPYFGAS
jgi:hypothetical protein